MVLIICSAEPSTTAELTKRSKFSKSESHSESFQHSSSSSSVLALQKVQMEANSIQLKPLFSESKSSNKNDGFAKGSSSEVHASKDKNGSKFDSSSNSFEENAQSQDSASNVHAADKHGNHFDSSKSSSEASGHFQGSSST
ncbi:20272_t:CDS:2, partial [Gigaspora rosea]